MGTVIKASVRCFKKKPNTASSSRLNNSLSLTLSPTAAGGGAGGAVFVTVPGTKRLSSHPPRCACGQLTTQHVAIPPGANSVEEAIQLVQIDTPKDKWSVIKHTRTYPTDAFGVIEFQGGGFINKAMVRLLPSACGGRNSMKGGNSCHLGHVDFVR